MSFQSQLRTLEAAIASWELPPELPMEKLQRTAAEFGIPVERVVSIWRHVMSVAPNGLYGSALMFYLDQLHRAREELTSDSPADA